MALQTSTTAAVKIAHIIFVARIISTRWILVDGVAQEWAFVSVPELGEGWIAPTAFVRWMH
jgi:hypothetical protein